MLNLPRNSGALNVSCKEQLRLDSVGPGTAGGSQQPVASSQSFMLHLGDSALSRRRILNRKLPYSFL